MSNAVPSTLLPSNYCKYVYFVFHSIYIFDQTRRIRAGSLSATRARSPDDHDRDDGVAESPYMLIQGSARLTN
jgi:hypothetical protein